MTAPPDEPTGPPTASTHPHVLVDDGGTPPARPTTTPEGPAGDGAARWHRPRPTADQLRLNAVFALGLFLSSILTMTLISMTNVYPHASSTWVSVPLLALTTLPLAWRFTRPWLSLVLVALGFGLVGTLGVTEAVVVSIALFLALYSEGAWDPDRRRAAWLRSGVVIAMFAWILVTLFHQSTDPDLLRTLPADATGWALSPFVAYMLLQLLYNAVYFAGAHFFGQQAWRSARDRSRMEDLARSLSAQRRRGEEQAIALERVRIARELHDSVAHHISLLGVRAGAARLALAHPDQGVPQARAALGDIEDTARETLADMHSILHALRGDGPLDDATSPTASLDLLHLPDLVAEATAAGFPTSLTTVDGAAEIGPRTSLTLYRVAQEALTNVRRHTAAGTRIDVRLRHGEDWVELEVANSRPPRRLRLPRSDSGGLGLIGMRERVESCGGTLRTGPLSSGGWLVRARLPLGGGR